MLWDEGYWLAAESDVDKALSKSELKFIFIGKRLKGLWVTQYQARCRIGLTLNFATLCNIINAAAELGMQSVYFVAVFSAEMHSFCLQL